MSNLFTKMAKKSNLLVKLVHEQVRFDQDLISLVVNRRCDCVKIISIIYLETFSRF
ncbi:hypothetical protein NTGHW29_60082 [Candidatus Nitrotoga sp. HW29]|nr:hypothetical protein NTGHW29_60082 [Candidatus Nitrotoga sp. HW29]